VKPKVYRWGRSLPFWTWTCPCSSFVSNRLEPTQEAAFAAAYAHARGVLHLIRASLPRRAGEAS
jgi:hypothetical protein